jgi:hypothetical protein
MMEWEAAREELISLSLSLILSICKCANLQYHLSLCGCCRLGTAKEEEEEEGKKLLQASLPLSFFLSFLLYAAVLVRSFFGSAYHSSWLQEVGNDGSGSSCKGCWLTQFGPEVKGPKVFVGESYRARLFLVRRS